MLYLAQVQKNITSGGMELQCLARQTSPQTWESSKVEVLPVEDSSAFNEGVLVLVECTGDREIVSIKEAKDWILNFLQQHSTQIKANSSLLEEEQAIIERWRQEITSQSLELNRRALEVETHREQLQELEQALKQKQEQLMQQENYSE
jgi:hypothetical protein